jgi:hypothetical protein
MNVSNSSWYKAPVEEKLEMVREDIEIITEAHNRMAKDFMEKLRQMAADIAAIKEHLEMK